MASASLTLWKKEIQSLLLLKMKLNVHCGFKQYTEQLGRHTSLSHPWCKQTRLAILRSRECREVSNFFFFLHCIWNTFYNLNEPNQFLLSSGTNMFCLKVFLHLPLRSRMWLQSRQKHLRYDLYYKATTRRLHWEKHASLPCIHLPGKSLWHYQEESSLDCSWAYQMPTEGCKTQPTVSWWYAQSGPL